MVKIEGLTKEEIDLRDKTDRLEIIAGAFFKSIADREVKPLGNGNIAIINEKILSKEYQIVVYPKTNVISVRSRFYFNEARDLAEKYEKAYPEQEWTVKKTYEP